MLISAFVCNSASCGVRPEVILFDGTTLSFQKAALKDFTCDLQQMPDFNSGR